MFSKLYSFVNPTLYEFDSDLIDFTTSQKPKLKLQDNPNQNFIENFTSDSGFTYDSNLAEFTSGVLRQKDQRPSNSVIAATFTNSLNANWGADGIVDVSANLNGAPTLSSGTAVCTGTNGLYYEDTQIGALSGNFVVKVKYTPNYTTSPPQNIDIITITRSSGTTDRINIFNSPSGNNLRITANGLPAVTLGTWTPTSGQAYVFELHCVNNVVSLYVDDVQIGTDKTINPSQGTTSNRIWLGACSLSYNVALGSFDDLILYSTASQTSVYTIPEYSFLESYVTLPEMVYTGAGTLISFDAFIYTSVGNLLIALQIGRSGVWSYWNGTAWVTGVGTKNYMSTMSLFSSNVPTLDVEGQIYGQFKLYFPNSNIQGYIDILNAFLTAQAYSLTNPGLLFLETIDMEGVLDFTETAIKLGSDEIKYILYKNDIPYYFNGTSWTLSSGNYSQSNTASEIDANKDSFVDIGVTFYIKSFLHSDNGVTSPQLNFISVDYDFWGGDTGERSKCVVYGTFYKEDGITPDDNVLISCRLSSNYVIYNNKVIIENIPVIETETNENGYWEIELIETENMNNGVYWIFSILSASGRKIYKKSIPNQKSINFVLL